MDPIPPIPVRGLHQSTILTHFFKIDEFMYRRDSPSRQQSVFSFVDVSTSLAETSVDDEGRDQLVNDYNSCDLCRDSRILVTHCKGDNWNKVYRCSNL